MPDFSEEDFFRLFSNEPFLSLTPDNRQPEVIEQLKNFVGTRPSDLLDWKASSLLFNQGYVSDLDFFQIFPAILRVYIYKLEDSLAWDLSEFVFLSEELDPNSADVPRLTKTFETLNYGHDQIQMIISMLAAIRSKYLLEDHPSYKSFSKGNAVSQALDDAIACFRLVLYEISKSPNGL